MNNKQRILAVSALLSILVGLYVAIVIFKAM